MKLTLCFLATLLLSPLAHSQPKQSIPLDLVIVSRPDITTQQQIDLFLQGVNRLKEVGVTIAIRRIREVPDYLQRNQYADYVNRLFDWEKFLRRKKWTSKYRQVHMLLPPVVYNGVSYQGGVAGAVCVTKRNTDRKFSYSIMRLTDSSGTQSRTQHSVIATAHELLHTVGANHHDSPPNIMHSAAMMFAYQYLPILKVTQREVNYCSQGRSPAGRRSFISDYDKPFD